MKIDSPRVADEAADRAVTSLLRAAKPLPSPGPLPGEAEAVAEFRAVGHDNGSPLMHSNRTHKRVLVAAAATAGMLTFASAAAAATGTLPGAAQQTARDMLAKVGVTVPGPDEHSAGHADTRGKSHATHADKNEPKNESKPPEHPSSHGKGAEVSSLAKSTTATGVDKGAEISTLASGGKSHAGEHGKPEEPGAQGTGHKPDDPGSQGTDHQPADPGSQGTIHQPADPGSQGTDHQPDNPGSTGEGTAEPHRP